jgi:hypothetical protein
LIAQGLSLHAAALNEELVLLLLLVTTDSVGGPLLLSLSPCPGLSFCALLLHARSPFGLFALGDCSSLGSLLGRSCRGRPLDRRVARALGPPFSRFTFRSRTIGLFFDRSYRSA